MRNALAILVLLMATAPAARAEEDECNVPMADWQPRDAVVRVATGRGWTVRRIRIDDGCYEVHGMDAQGRPIEATLDPATLELIELEFESDDDDHHERDRHGHEDGHPARHDHGEGQEGGHEGGPSRD